jgi:hypothetical protein
VQISVIIPVRNEEQSIGTAVFIRTELDFLVFENFVLDKQDQPEMMDDTD